MCEKNHHMVDVILERLVEDYPKTKETLLAWANMAKNLMQNIYGFSLNQLVF